MINRLVTYYLFKILQMVCAVFGIKDEVQSMIYKTHLLPKCIFSPKSWWWNSFNPLTILSLLRISVNVYYASSNPFSPRLHPRPALSEETLGPEATFQPARWPCTRTPSPSATARAPPNLSRHIWTVTVLEPPRADYEPPEQSPASHHSPSPHVIITCVLVCSSKVLHSLGTQPTGCSLLNHLLIFGPGLAYYRHSVNSSQMNYKYINLPKKFKKKAKKKL